MEDKIDLIIGGIFFLFFIIGCFKGFLKSIIGPLSLVACWAYAISYYNQTQKFMVCIAISLLGPIILSFCVSLVIKGLRKLFNREDDISPLSRLLGGIISMAWSGFYFILMMLLVVMIPFKNPKFVNFKDALKGSKTYQLAKFYIGDNVSLFSNLEKISSAIENPEMMKEISNSKKFQKLITDSKIQNLYDDPEIQKLVNEKNYSALMTNPKVQEMMKDKELMTEFVKIINEHASGGLSSNGGIDKESFSEE